MKRNFNKDVVYCDGFEQKTGMSIEEFTTAVQHLDAPRIKQFVERGGDLNELIWVNDEYGDKVLRRALDIVDCKPFEDFMRRKGALENMEVYRKNQKVLKDFWQVKVQRELNDEFPKFSTNVTQEIENRLIAAVRRDDLEPILNYLLNGGDINIVISRDFGFVEDVNFTLLDYAETLCEMVSQAYYGDIYQTLVKLGAKSFNGVIYARTRGKKYRSLLLTMNVKFKSLWKNLFEAL